MKTTTSHLRNLFNKLLKRKQKKRMPIIRITPEMMKLIQEGPIVMAGIRSMNGAAGFVPSSEISESWTELKKAAAELQNELDKYELHQQIVRRKNYASLRRAASQRLWLLRRVQLAFRMLL